MSSGAPLTVSGWSLYAHPLFLDQLETLIGRVEALKEKDPRDFHRKNDSKRLAAIIKLAFEIIPQNPTRSDYHQGNTLGDAHRHWFRAKFFQQYRLFFRFHAASRVIVYAWVNDTDTLRAYGSKQDAYRVFGKMLDNGHPPNDWDDLVKQATGAASRLEAAIPRL